MKPVLIFAHAGRHFAWDALGRCVASTFTYPEIEHVVTLMGYDIIPLNSSLARDIKDMILISRDDVTEKDFE